MTMPDLAIIVSYCSNEAAFLNAQLAELAKVQKAVMAKLGGRCQLIFSIGSHLFNMKSDGNAPDAVRLAAQRHDATIDIVTYDVGEDVHAVPRKYHNLAREKAVQQLTPNVKYWVLFLDADEIPEGDTFAKWFLGNVHSLRSIMAYKFACYWYFLKPTWRAREEEDSMVLIHADQLTVEALRGEHERDSLVKHCPGGCLRRLVDTDGCAMFHHYSWVRSKECILHKIRTWGHRNDKDWERLVEEHWSSSGDPGRDFVHGYQYEPVQDRFGLSALLG